MISHSANRLWLPVLFVLVAALPSLRSEERVSIDGAGASFPQPLYVRWFEHYSQVDDSVEFNYRGLGSASGRTLIAAGEVDFGASDLPFSDGAVNASKISHLPTVASAVAICYTLPGVDELQIDGPTVAAIFLGQITQWNDPAIQKQNPKTKLPALPIVPVHLAEGGTLTSIFSRYLTAVSSDWRKRFGEKLTIDWPVGTAGTGNVGAARVIRSTAGAIGYLEWSAAKNHGVAIAALKNSSGRYVSPSVESITAAIAATQIPDDFRFAVINPTGATSYPVGILTWLLINPDSLEAEKGRKLVAFLNWAYADGTTYAPPLGFAPLPENLLARVRARIAQLHF